MKLRNKKIFITGGAGFIGSHLATHLAQNNSVTVYDNLSSSTRTKAQLKQFDIKLVTGDVLDLPKLKRSTKNIDVVFHMSAAHLRASLSDPVYNHDVNTKGALHTLLAAADNDVEKFIAISSSEVYGTAESSKMSETHPIHPTTVYGMSKYMEELYVELFHKQYGLDTTIIRPFNTYGPYSHFDGVFGEVIPRFVVMVINGKQPTIFGSGDQSRDFTYVSDTVSGIVAASQSDDLSGKRVNVARGIDVSINTIAKLICKKAGLPCEPQYLPPRPHDVERHIADISRIKKHTTWTPTVDIEEGIDKLVDWFRDTYRHPETLLKLMPKTNW